MRTPSVLSLLLGIAAGSTGAWAQQAPVGTVAMVVGAATVARGTAQQPVPLKLRDGVFLRDRIATGEQSFLRVLLGGKATVTAREHSILTITEMPAVSTIGLATGRIAVAVSKDRMQPGEAVEIRLPNAMAVIRGTVVIAEVFQTSAGTRGTFTILRGVVEVTRLDPASGQPVGASVTVGALERITVSGAGALPTPDQITADAAASLYGQFTVIPREALPAGREAVTSIATDLAQKDALQVTGTVTTATGGLGGTPSARASGVNGGAEDATSVTSGASSVSVPGGATLPGPSGAPILPGGVPSLPKLPKLP